MKNSAEFGIRNSEYEIRSTRQTLRHSAFRIPHSALGVGLAILFLIPAHTAWAFSFSVEPARIELSVPAGKRRGKIVVVNNSRSDQPLHVKMYVQDVVYLPDGTNDYVPPGSTEWSCANWLSITPTELDVSAGKSAEVRISAIAPEGAQGGHYAIVFFETSPTYTAQQGVGVNFRLGALTEIIVPNTEQHQATLAKMSLTKPREVGVDIFNEGNVLVRPKGKVKIFDQHGKRVGQVDFNPQRLGVLPKTLRSFHVPLDRVSLSRGTYRVKAEIDYGTKYLLVGELPFSVE